MTNTPPSFLSHQITNTELSVIFAGFGFLLLVLASVILTSLIAKGVASVICITAFVLALYYVMQAYKEDWKNESNGL